jgi:4,5-DOPA dioxygenase extradiol
MSDTPKMPVLFIGHGSPLNITAHNSYTESLEKLGKKLPVPKAIMVISAHWLTGGSTGSTRVTCMEKPRTIYDFSGFPADLYTLKYDCPGAPDLAKQAVDTVKTVHLVCDTEWGLDHASWSILKHMYPEANIPVFEMSLDYAFGSRSVKPLSYHYDLAQGLQALRSKGILIIGSGNIVHNLRMVDFSRLDGPTEAWARDMDDRVKTNLLKQNHEDLVHYLSMGRNASMGIPSLDHYLPMIYAIALQEKNEPLKFVYEGFQNGSISMRSFQIG